MANSDATTLANLKTLRDDMISRGGAKRIEINGRTVTFHSLREITDMIDLYEAKTNTAEYGAAMKYSFDEVDD